MSFELVDMIFDAPLLNSEKSVLLAIARHVNSQSDFDNLTAFPSRDLIAYEAGCKDPSTVSRQTAALKAKGLITVSEKYERTPRGGLKQISNDYRINYRALLALIVEKSPYEKHREHYRPMLDYLTGTMNPALHDARGVDESRKGGTPDDARGVGGMVQGGSSHSATQTRKENREGNREEDQSLNQSLPPETRHLGNAGAGASGWPRNPGRAVKQLVDGGKANDRDAYVSLAEHTGRPQIVSYYDAGNRFPDSIGSVTAGVHELDKIEAWSSSAAGETQGVETAHPSQGAVMAAESLDPFETFWKAYPRKEGKLAAKKAFNNALRQGTPAPTILEGVRRYADDPNLPREDEARYVPNPKRWLEEQRWEALPLPPRPDRRTAAEKRNAEWAAAYAKLQNEPVQYLEFPEVETHGWDTRHAIEGESSYGE